MQQMEAVLVLESKKKEIAQSELWRLVQAYHTNMRTRSGGKLDARTKKVLIPKNF